MNRYDFSSGKPKIVPKRSRLIIGQRFTINSLGLLKNRDKQQGDILTHLLYPATLEITGSTINSEAYTINHSNGKAFAEILTEKEILDFYDPIE